MCADGFGGLGGGDRRVADIKGGFGGVAEQSGAGVAGEDVAFDPDDGGDVGLPVGASQGVGRIEGADDAAFVAVAALVVALDLVAWRRGCGQVRDLLTQGRLVILDLDDQGDAGVGGGVEEFF